MTKHSPFRYFKTSPEFIRQAMMLYVNFPLSLRNVEDFRHEYPRTVEQARALRSLLTQPQKKADVVIDLEVDDEALIEKIRGGTPAQTVLSDTTSNSKRRAADNEETVRKRSEE